MCGSGNFNSFSPGSQGRRRASCNKAASSDECTEIGVCQWCENQGKCKVDFANCGSAAGNVCKGVIDAEACGILGEECMWCGDDIQACRPSDDSCDAAPSGGVGNPCKAATDADTCAAAGEGVCVFCEELGKCEKVQKGCRVTGNPCKEAEDIDQCNEIAGGTVCSWCASAGICTKGGGSCGSEDDEDSVSVDSEDGSIRGNPCKDATSEEGCTEINTALGVDACQYCAEQSKCKKNDDVCDSPSREVDLGLQEKKAEFSVFDSGLGETDKNQVSVALQKAEEKTANGMAVGRSVDAGNSEFTISQVQGIVFTGVEARKVSFSSKQGENGIGMVKMDVFQFLSDGEVVNEDEVYSVREGDVKFNVEVKNWQFCDGEDGVECASEGNGMYVDVSVKVKGREKAQGSGLMFDLGGNVPLSLSNQVMVDGVTTELPEGYPQYVEDDDGGVFIFRIPRFTESALYDPIIEYHEATYEEYESSSGGDGSTSSSPSCRFLGSGSASVFGFIAAIVAGNLAAELL